MGVETTRNAWILVANRQNTIRSAESGCFGVERFPGRFLDVRIDDSVVFYVTGEGVLTGLGAVTRGCQ